MRHELGTVGLVVLSLACGQSSSSTDPSAVASPRPSGSSGTASAPAPSGVPSALRVDLTVNDSELGSFSCRAGMVFATSVTNTSARAVRLDRLTVEFAPSSGYCDAFTTPMYADVDALLPGGRSMLVHRFDGAGALCEAPNRPGCAWTASVELSTEAGVARDHLGFSTYDVSRDCDGAVPRLATPRGGEVLSGVVSVTASVVESRACATSARTIVQAFSERGELVFSSPELDLGDRYRWDTRSLRNGRYGLTAQQNCCRIPSAAIHVTLRN